MNLYNLCDYKHYDKRIKPKHHLWTLMFAKVYSTETVLSSLAQCTRRTHRKWIWKIAPIIAAQYPEVVSFVKKMCLQQKKL